MKKIFNNKYFILFPICLLLIISIFVINDSTTFGKKQFLFFVLFLSIIFIVQKINIKWIINNSHIFYYLNILLLIAVLLFSKEINGSKAWIDLYYFKFQPSETMKVMLLLYLIKINSNKKNILYMLIIVLLPSILTYLEPDTGAVIIYFIIFLGIIIHSHIKKSILLILSLITISLIGASWYLYMYQQELFIKIFGTSIFYRIDRLIDFKEQSNIQITNALISIGSHKFLYFPEFHNDFIFAYILSSYPLFISIIILMCFFLIFKYLLGKKNPIFTSFFLIMLFQTFQNLLMNIGLVPIIGIPLPFLSYGGSYLLSFAILTGITINIYNKDNSYMDNHMMDMVDKVDMVELQLQDEV